MPQKAYCRDYDRLISAVADLDTKIRTIPAPTDGASTPPPDVEPGDFQLWRFPLPGEYPPSEPRLPGMERFGVLIIDSTSTDTAYYILRDGHGGSDPDAPGAIAVVYGFLMHDQEHFVKDPVNLPAQSITFGMWDNAAAEIARLRAGIYAFRVWADGVSASADNSETRAAMAECVRRLDDLESTIAETMKKWRQH